MYLSNNTAQAVHHSVKQFKLKRVGEERMKKQKDEKGRVSAEE